MMQKFADELALSRRHRRPSHPWPRNRLRTDASEPAKVVEMFGLKVANTNMDEALHWIIRRAASGKKTLINFVNAHCLNVACKDRRYRSILAQSSRLLPDGSGVALAMRLRGVALKENLNGTDLFPNLCREAAAQGLSMYLLGAEPGVASRAAEKMRARFSDLKIAGTHDGFFTRDQEDNIIRSINRSGADILLVALGVPRQELWIARHLDRLGTSVNMGVGGLFDFYSGRIPRAPLWLRRLGLEWSWRLMQEPRRMWRRYIVGNPEFVLRAWLDARRQRQSDIGLKRNQGAVLARKLSRWCSRRAADRFKRTVDVVGAATALLLASPLLAITALAIRLESPGPVFFSQERVGLRGHNFRFWKFRSMYVDAEQRRMALMAENEMEGGVLFKMKHDPRITRVGRIIRRFSIDELPQLWNVLCGDMALVGPRPALPPEVAQYTLADRQRLLVPPGITCIWQVSGRSDIPFHRQVAMDMEYIHSATLRTDIRLLLKTIPAVVSGRGAY